MNLATRAKCPLPMIEPEAGAAPQQVTLTGSPGNALYYTLDGTLPVPGKAGTTLYTVPFTVATAATLRVIATAIGKAASNVEPAQFS